MRTGEAEGRGFIHPDVRLRERHMLPACNSSSIERTQSPPRGGTLVPVCRAT